VSSPGEFHPLKLSVTIFPGSSRYDKDMCGAYDQLIQSVCYPFLTDPSQEWVVRP
jgi:hypothetical protein